MDSSRRGIGTSGKAAAVAVIIIIALGAVYFLPKLSSSSQSQSSGPSSGAEAITGMTSLFSDFSHMTVSVNVNDQADQYTQNANYSYTVLGKGTLNSTTYTKVEYATVGLGDNVVAWYNSTGGIGELDVVGVRNYTGNGAGNLPFITNYVSTFGGLIAVTENATLLSHLTKTSQAQMSIGPTKMEVTTYTLQGRLSGYSSLTIELATIPGTNVQFATYLNEKSSDGTTSAVQVTSLTI